MTRRGTTNVAASVRQRLLDHTRKYDLPFQEVLTLYAMERFLYRLAESPHVDTFVLKGAMMMRVWDVTLARPTMDIDLLSRRTMTKTEMRTAMHQVLHAPVTEDGLRFDADAVQIDEIRGQQKYLGLRVRMDAELAVARIKLQLDVGFGDAVTPPASLVAFPVLLDHPQPRLHGYLPETSVAEKFSAMVDLGMANTRLKDYFDIWMLATTRAFDGAILADATRETFRRRGLALPNTTPLALSSAFAKDPAKQRQWSVFLAKMRLGTQPTKLADVVAIIETFLIPVADAVESGRPFHARWTPASGWSRLGK